MVVVVALLGGLIPTILYMAGVWWLDRYEKEPLWLLVMVFFWGAVPAAFLSVFFELLFDIPVSALGGESLVANLLSVSVGAPLIEESCKGIVLIGLVLAVRKEFDDVLDGILYGATVGLGFALTENVVAYFLPILDAEGMEAGLTNIFMRSVVFGLNHAFWTGLTGAALGYALLSRKSGRGGFETRPYLLAVTGWGAAVLFHAIHNAGAVLAENTSCFALGLSLVVDWGGLLLLLVVAALALRRESRWIARGLEEEVRQGAISRHELELLSSAGRRMMLRWHSFSRGGRQAYRGVGRYFQSATELAFAKQRLRSQGGVGGNLGRVQELRQELAIRRSDVLPWLGSG